MLSSGSLNLGKSLLVSRRDHLALISLPINQPGVHNPGTCRVNTSSGCLIDFGVFTTYVATEVVCSYPDVVLEAEDPPMLRAARGPRVDRPAGCVAVMMVGVTEEVFRALPTASAVVTGFDWQNLLGEGCCPRWRSPTVPTSSPAGSPPWSGSQVGCPFNS